MAKSKETYLRVAETYEKMGKKKWAEAKNNPDEGYKYQQARDNFDTARRARESANKMK